MRSRSLAVLAVAALSLPGLPAALPLLAQQAVSLVPGQRVRVTAAAPHADAWIGEVVGSHDGRLVVRLDSTHAETLAVGEIRRLELSRGMGSSARAGAGIGGVAGFVAGLVAGFATRPRGRPCKLSDDWLGILDPDLRCVVTIAEDVGWVGALGAGGGLAGVGLGALIGLPFHAERWERMPPDRVRLEVVPQAGALGVGVGIAF
jgi:hypothetical protein